MMGLSGAFLVFKDDYVRLTLPEARTGIVPDAQTLAQISEAAEAVFGADAVRSVVFARPDFGLTDVRLKSGEHAYIDQSGAIIDQWSGHNRFDQWVFDLHHYLLAGDTGEFIIGIAGLLCIALIISGLIALWPTRRAIGLRVMPKSKARRDLLASHRNLGLFIALPLLMFVLTGTGMVFSSQSRALLSVFDGANSEMPAPVVAGTGDIDWYRAMAEAQTFFPDGQIRIAIWPRKSRSEASVRLKQPAEWHPNGRTYAVINPVTSEVVSTSDALSEPRGERLYNSFYPLHSARIGGGAPGRLYDLASALTGLGLFLLGVVGCYAFLTKPMRFRRRVKAGF